MEMESFHPDEVDSDGDGYIIGAYDLSIWQGSSSVIGGGDHDDNNPYLTQEPELVDGIDNDGNGIC